MTNDNKPVEGYDVITNGWRKDMGWCVIRPGECVANVPEACICKQMPRMFGKRCTSVLMESTSHD